MKIRFHRHTIERSFRSVGDLARFAQRQAERFGALEKDSPRDFSLWARQIRDGWNSLASAARNGHDQEYIQARAREQPVLTFESTLVRHLRLMVQQQRDDAVSELIPVLTGSKDGQRADRLSLVAIITHAEMRAILALETKSWKGDGDSSFADLAQLHEERLDRLLEDDRAEIEQKRSNFEHLINESATRFEQLAQIEADAVVDRRAKWEATHNQFVEELRLRTAVSLWSGRARVHRQGYRMARKWSLIFGSGGLMFLLAWIFGGYAFAAYLFDDKTAQVASYVAGSIATFTLFVWGLRVLIRSMMSQEHLSTDASARSALAHTYLALERNGAASESERAIILAALFAPVSDGILKDDGMPTLSPTSVAANLISRPG